MTILNSSQVRHPASIYLDASDTLYATDETRHVVWKFSKNDFNPTIVAGLLSVPGSNASQLLNPRDVDVDRNGNIYVTDYGNARVQKYTSGSTMGTTIAGITGRRGFTLNQPRFSTLDANESFIFVSDSNNHRILRFPTDPTTGVAAAVVAGGAGSGNLASQLNYPSDIGYRPEQSSDLFIGSSFGHSIIRWAPGASSGTFVAGVPGSSGSNATLLNQPMDVKVDPYLNIYVADYLNNRIQLFCSNNRTGITIAGTGVAGNASNLLNAPRSLAFDSAMNLYVSDLNNRRVQKFFKL